MLRAYYFLQGGGGGKQPPPPLLRLPDFLLPDFLLRDLFLLLLFLFLPPHFLPPVTRAGALIASWANFSVMLILLMVSISGCYFDCDYSREFWEYLKRITIDEKNVNDENLV